jgi:GxxExxY protein
VIPVSRKRIIAPHEDLTYKIIGCAMAVHRRLGAGLPEETYEKALIAEFEKAGLGFERQKEVQVHDGNVFVGFYFLDFLIEEKVVVELKALGFLDGSHLAQVITYLVATGLPVGLLIDFGGRSLKHRRILPPKDATHRVNRQWLFVPDWLKE